MPFMFYQEAYNFNSRWDAAQRSEGIGILETSVREGWTTTKTTNALKEAGLSYRRTDMLDDIARAVATEWSRTETAYENSERWFNSLEKYRELFGNPPRAQAVDFMHKWANESFETVDEIEAADVLEGLDYVPGS